MQQEWERPGSRALEEGSLSRAILQLAGELGEGNWGGGGMPRRNTGPSPHTLEGREKDPVGCRPDGPRYPERSPW